jgi:hypothetical protein
MKWLHEHSIAKYGEKRVLFVLAILHASALALIVHVAALVTIHDW